MIHKNFWISDYVAVSAKDEYHSRGNKRYVQLTVIVIIDQGHPVFHKCADQPEDRSCRSLICKCLELGSVNRLLNVSGSEEGKLPGIGAPDGTTKEVPKQVSISTSILSAFQGGRGRWRASQVSRCQIKRKRKNE